MAVKELLDERISECRRGDPEVGQLTVCLESVIDRVSGVERVLQGTRSKHQKSLNEACSMVEDISKVVHGVEERLNSFQAQTIQAIVSNVAFDSQAKFSKLSQEILEVRTKQDMMSQMHHTNVSRVTDKEQSVGTFDQEILKTVLSPQLISPYEEYTYKPSDVTRR